MRRGGRRRGGGRERGGRVRQGSAGTARRARGARCGGVRARARPAVVGRCPRLRDDPGRPAARRGRDRPRRADVDGAARARRERGPGLRRGLARDGLRALGAAPDADRASSASSTSRRACALPRGRDAAVGGAPRGAGRAHGRAARLPHGSLVARSPLRLHELAPRPAGDRGGGSALARQGASDRDEPAAAARRGRAARRVDGVERDRAGVPSRLPLRLAAGAA